jgi:hypothetical protein
MLQFPSEDGYSSVHCSQNYSIFNIFGARITSSIPSHPVEIVSKITGFLDFVHRPEFKIFENITFRKMDLFPFSDKGRETYTLLVSLEITVLVFRIPDDKQIPETQ